MEMSLSAERSTRSRRYDVSKAVLIRICGLPSTIADELTYPALAKSIDRAQLLSERILECAQRLSDELYAAVSAAGSEREDQRALLRMRRDVFNNRMVPADIAQRCVGYLPNGGSSWAEWRTLRTELDEHNRRAERALNAWLHDQRTGSIPRLATIRDFRKGLLTSSESFENSLQSYLCFGGRNLDKRLRRTEHALISYLFRTTHKPSPFGTFTSVALGMLRDAAGTSTLEEIHSPGLMTSAKPNLAIASRLRYAIAKSATNFAGLRLSLKAGARIVGERIEYRRSVEHILGISGPLHAALDEYAFVINQTPSLRAIYGRLRTCGAMTVGEITDVLVADLCMSDIDATAYVQLLVDNDLLVPTDLTQSVFDEHAWAAFVDGLRRIGHPATDAAARHLEKLDSRVIEYAAADIGSRQQFLSCENIELEAVVKAVNPAVAAPRPILYEDACASPVAVPLNRDAWEPIVADLAEIQPVLALFDPLMVSKVMLRHIFRRRYGTDGICDDIAGFSDFFQDSFYRPFADTGIVARSNAFSGSALNYLQVPEVTEILNARTGLASYLESVLAGSGIREIELPQALVSELRAVGLAQQPLLSNSFFIQLFGRGASAGAVLNDVQRGVGSMMTRFQHVFSEADRNMSIDTLRSNISLLENDETVVAQFQGGYFTNLNAHSLMTRFEIVMPGERSSAPPERLLHLHELSLRYDSSRRQVNLFCERIAKYVVPIYTGMLFPLALPELQILLLHLGTPVRLDTDLFSTSERAAGEVAYRPRLRYGRIILQRERWLVDIETLPARDVSETDYAYFSRLVTWQRGCRIPVRCFAQIRTASAQKAPPRSDALLPRKDATPVQRDKPFLVDFDNPFLLLGLERSVAGRGGAIAFTEMLPADDDLSLLYNGKPHISEFVLDITCKGAL